MVHPSLFPNETFTNSSVVCSLVYYKLDVTLGTIFCRGRIFNPLQAICEPSSNMTYNRLLPLSTILILQYKSQIQRLSYVLDFSDNII